MSDLLHPRLADCRRLFLRDFDIAMMIGAYDSERAAPQRVVFNVDVFVPLVASTSGRDDLAEVVDYNLMRDAIRAIAARGHIDLQETLCDAVASALLAHPQVRAVRVSTQKPDAYPDCAGVGVEVFRFSD